MRNQAFIGHSAWCGVCKSAGKIATGPGTPGPNLRMHDATLQAREAVEGDIVLCKCERAPKLVAVYGRMSYIQDDSDMHADARFISTAFDAPSMVSATSPANRQQPHRHENKSVEPRCTLRIGVFFDGTGNNAGNTQLFEQCKASTGSALRQSPEDQRAIAAHCKPYMLKAGSSYEGGYTNVWRLYQLYRDSSAEPFEQNKTNFFSKIYVDGIGTTAGQPDSLLPGYAFGTGETGMVERVNNAIIELIPKQVLEFSNRYPDIAIENIEFDVFGFSRGAAAARHFVNEINRKQQGPLTSKLRSTDIRLATDFDYNTCIRVGFVGLFDTVVSYGSLVDGFNVRAGNSGPLHAGLPAGCARKVVQIAARDEHRANFMLTTVAPQHQEIKLPGVHSDIGGGYNSTKEGDLMLIEPIHHDEPLAMLNTLRVDLTQSKAWREAQQQRQLWKQRLGGIDDNDLTIDGWLVVQHQQIDRASVVKQAIPTVYATLKLNRTIDPSYQLVVLRVMHKLALDFGVQWSRSPDDVPEMRLPSELYPIAAKLLANQSLDQSEEALLSRRYLHQSANWNFGPGARFLESGISINLLYPNRPECDSKGNELARKVLPNT